MTTMITREATYVADAFNANIASGIFLTEAEAVEHFVKCLAAEEYSADNFKTLAEAEASAEVRDYAEDLAADYMKESKTLEQHGDVADYFHTSADANCADVEVRADRRRLRPVRGTGKPRPGRWPVRYYRRGPLPGRGHAGN